jgi:uncharacterized protein YqeY
MNLKQKISEDLISAMKQRDIVKRDTLRFLDAAIKNVEIEKKKREEGLSDGEVQEVIARSVKQRKDSIAQYSSAGRQDLVEKEEAELAILMVYMPKQMDEDKVREEVKKIITESGASGKSEMGKVMGLAMIRLKGQADGQVVRKMVEEELK